MEDPFDSILHAEHRAAAAGQQDGHAQGRVLGFIDGYELGCAPASGAHIRCRLQLLRAT